MKVSIIIPCFNNAALVAETLTSVKNQSASNWECVLVDDGSTDGSLAVAHSFAKEESRFTVLSRPAYLPKGANSCRNFGVSKSTGTHLVFLDADDLLSENCIEVRCHSYQEEDLKIFSTAHFQHSIAQSSPFVSSLNLNLDAARYRDMFLRYWIPWHGSSGLWKREFYEQIGGFDERLMRFQDVDLHVRALSVTGVQFSIDYSAGFTSYYRKSAYHTQVNLEKRRFILDQGIQYLEKLDGFLTAGDLRKTSGLMIYLMFRFEEVFTDKDLAVINRMFVGSSHKAKPEGGLQLLMRVYSKVLTKPSRLRKYLSFAVYKVFSKQNREKLNH
ncbi:glycosyltransferase family 2 protein [Algoriphagus halophytocola]|uniref:Glycosyltransferase family 2 protein n=1 Tax=Algoriphagus halophytocola TaxID=2991499 RepID=A0ABY6ML82_9BACT|nr:glycosyltransferase family 2 protein [Algoriphagus sp. TR-M5]UZD23036.1 glycosyltransferase family 2 protein [Algoriphagus sp. TR-M5]